MSYLLILVDDDDLVAASVRLMLPKEWKLKTLGPFCAKDPELAEAHLFISDMHLIPGQTEARGLQLIAEVKKRHPQLPCVAISGDLSLSLMEQGIKAGAEAFLAKPLVKEELIRKLEEVKNYWDLKTIQAEADPSRPRWIGSSTKSQELLKHISLVRANQKPVLIEGESGSGKEVVSHLIGQQPGRPFISCNIAAIAENLLESELFGHVRGAFTGAERDKPGLVEAAHGGCLLLDEMEALSPAAQVKLLRFLESGEARRVGANQNYLSSARILATSNVPLRQLVEQGQFREDLYFRLHQNYIWIPPLRDRAEDIPELAEYFLKALRPRVNKSLLPESIERLKQHHYPGNVRELKRIVEQAAFLSPLPVIRPQDIEPMLPNKSLSLHAGEGFFMPVTYMWKKSWDENVKEWEKTALLQILKTYSPGEELAAKLGISRSSLYKKIKDYGIDINS